MMSEISEVSSREFSKAGKFWEYFEITVKDLSPLTNGLSMKHDLNFWVLGNHEGISIIFHIKELDKKLEERKGGEPASDMC